VWISVVVPLGLLLLAVLLQRMEAALLNSPDSRRTGARAPGGAVPDPAVPDPARPLDASPDRTPLVPVPAGSQRRRVPAHAGRSGVTA
jgi:hypothetical protein